MTEAPFIVFGSPRSRTKWTAGFLSYGDWRCGHDEIMHMRTKDDIASWFRQPKTGTVETAATPFWRLALKQWPNLKVVVLRRNVDAIIHSLFSAGLMANPDEMVRLIHRTDQKLAQIAKRIPRALSVRFEDLHREDVCAEVFEHCLPYRHDPKWWAEWDTRSVSGDLVAQRSYAAAYLPQLSKLARTARQMSISMMAPKTNEIEGMVFDVERFDDWYRDAQPLFREHMVATGQDVEDFRKKNIPLLQKIDQAGWMQIVTARMNGRMFGYLMSLISPSLDGPHQMAQHLPIYASSEFPGLGMKLERESIRRLRERGATEVFQRAGIRGSGPKMGALLNRLGFEDYGHLYRLDLQERV